MSRWPTQGVSPSRRDQKQIIAFLRPELAEAAHRRARQEGVTLREVIGEAINAAYAKTGRQPPFQMGHARIVRRTKARARVREESVGPRSRRGTRGVGGWFDERLVDDVASYANELGHSMQAFVAWGMELVTGVSRTDPNAGSPDDDKSKSKKAA